MKKLNSCSVVIEMALLLVSSDVSCLVFIPSDCDLQYILILYLYHLHSIQLENFDIPITISISVDSNVSVIMQFVYIDRFDHIMQWYRRLTVEIGANPNDFPDNYTNKYYILEY